MAALNAKKRKALPTTVFAIPSTRSYPIDTPARARAALARVVANGTPAQVTQVRNAVKKRYPTMAVTGTKPFPTKSGGAKTAKKSPASNKGFAARMAAARAAKKK